MVIQRIYIQPPPDPAADSLSPVQFPSLRQRSDTLNTEKGTLAASGDSPAPAQSSGVSVKRTPSTSTAKSISRLLSQHTGGSSYSEYAPGFGSSRPASPLDGIRAPSTMSVLKPSDFARRKAAFMQTLEPSAKFHAELERRYANPPSPLEVQELPQKPDAPRGTFVLPKLRSTSVQASGNSPLVTPPRQNSTSVTASPEKTVPVPNDASPAAKVEFQVLELNKKLIDSTVENKTLAAEITNKEKEFMQLQDKIRQSASATPDLPTPIERAVPKAKFDALKTETERAAKELEAIERKSEQRKKELEALAAQAAKLQSKEKAAEVQKVDPQNIAAKETLEQAVERLREQVEVARRQSSEVVSRRMSSSSRVSERYAPSTTRVPLGRNRRVNGTYAPSEKDSSAPPTPAATRMEFDDTKTVASVTSKSANRLSQVISIAPAEALPERDDVQRSIRSYYTEAVRSVSPLSPTLPTIRHSDYDGPSTEELSRDIASIMDGFSKESFGAGIVLDAVSEPAPPAPLSPVKMSMTKARDTASIRSKPSSASLRGGKKKGWISIFKVKLPGSGSGDGREDHASSKSPMLPPIAKSTPISL